ncbi:hypothetical protein C5167_025018 [Papaver somniferum]|uniref:Uncharacterized protein n=1 Tax=Papaver somniferum TaxID=3469 RepID=A0A4Y7JRV1_PAPSO|nr:hypothetical protein C5167_025018 [Papaver somniferum]
MTSTISNNKNEVTSHLNFSTKELKSKTGYGLATERKTLVVDLTMVFTVLPGIVNNVKTRHNRKQPVLRHSISQSSSTWNFELQFMGIDRHLYKDPDDGILAILCNTKHGVKRFNSPFSAGHWTCLEGNYLWLIQESS